MKVKKEMLLMDYLLLSYNRKNAKNLLKYKQVYVNNQQISQFDYLLHENDQVEIKKENTSSLEILYEDQEFVVINKPSGLLSMSDGKEKEKTEKNVCDIRTDDQQKMDPEKRASAFWHSDGLCDLDDVLRFLHERRHSVLRFFCIWRLCTPHGNDAIFFQRK
mgnify:CR=1 FL=1